MTPDPNPEKPRLLIVDDDELFCDVLASALSDRGYAIFNAHDSNVAMTLAQAEEPEYAVIDLRIGHESGLELVERLHHLNEKTRIVILTGYASVATAVEAIKLGAIHYLTKPANADEIVIALHQDEGNASVPPVTRPPTVQRLEWEHLQRILTECDGNISAAARTLRMHRRTLQRKLAKRPVAE